MASTWTCWSCVACSAPGASIHVTLLRIGELSFGPCEPEHTVPHDIPELDTPDTPDIPDTPEPELHDDTPEDEAEEGKKCGAMKGASALWVEVGSLRDKRWNFTASFFSLLKLRGVQLGVSKGVADGCKPPTRRAWKCRAWRALAIL
jgi:hypothetical protein